MQADRSTASEPRWFALSVRPQHEKTTAKVLHNKGLECFLPLYRSRRTWSDRIKHLELPLFPGYVFSRFSCEGRVSILNTPGVISIVGFGRVPTPVSDEEIEAIRKVVASGLPIEPWPFLQIGQRVRIERGPLCGLEGILLEWKGAWRAVLSVWLLKRSVAVEIDRDLVTPCALPCTRVAVAQDRMRV